MQFQFCEEIKFVYVEYSAKWVNEVVGDLKLEESQTNRQKIMGGIK